MIGGVSRTKLMLINEIITIKKIIHFTVNRQKRNRPIIFTENIFATFKTYREMLFGPTDIVYFKNFYF